MRVQGFIGSRRYHGLGKLRFDIAAVRGQSLGPISEGVHFPSLMDQHIYGTVCYMSVLKPTNTHIRREILFIMGNFIKFKSGKVPSIVVLHFQNFAAW